MKVCISLCAIFLTVLTVSGAYADAAPDPGEDPNPCVGKVAGDSCSPQRWGPKDKVCSWNEVSAKAMPEYFVRRIIARLGCSIISKAGEPLTGRCLECVPRSDSKGTPDAGAKPSIEAK